jgi:hypothetical protein
MRCASLLATGVVLLAGAGCGSAATTRSSSNAAATLGAQAAPSAEYLAAKHRFIDEEEAICRPAYERLARLRARIGPLPHVPRARAERAAELIEQEITLEQADFARMEPPPEPGSDVPLISSWLRSLRSAAAYAGEFAEALSAGENAAARTAYRKMTNADAHNKKLAAGYGFDFCSRLQ